MEAPCDPLVQSLTVWRVLKTYEEANDGSGMTPDVLKRFSGSSNPSTQELPLARLTQILDHVEEEVVESPQASLRYSRGTIVDREFAGCAVSSSG